MNIAKEVKKFNLPLGKYVVVGSGSMAALGIRDAGDIDIAVTKDLFEKMRKEKEWEDEMKYGKKFLKKSGVDIISQLNWEGYPTTTQEAIDSSILVDGIAFMNLHELKKFKAALGRKKDFKDIILIDLYLKKESG